MSLGLRHFMVGKESVYGTAVTPTEPLEATGWDVKLERATEKIHGIRGFSARAIVELNKIVRGTVTTKLNPEEIGLMLKALYGAVTTSGAGPYTHTYPPSTGIPATGRAGVSLTAQGRVDGSLCFNWAGVKITSMALTVNPDRTAEIVWGIQGSVADSAASPATPTFPTLRTFALPQLTIQFDGVSLDARSLDLQAAFEVDAPFTAGSASLQKEPAETSEFGVSATIEVIFENMTQYNKFAAHTDVDVSIVMSDGTQSLTINLDKCKLKQATPPVQGRERVMVSYELDSYFSATATDCMQMILVNNDQTIP